MGTGLDSPKPPTWHSQNVEGVIDPHALGLYIAYCKKVKVDHDGARLAEV